MERDNAVSEMDFSANQDPNAVVEAVYEDEENDLDDEGLQMSLNFSANSPQPSYRSKSPETNISYTHACPVCKRGFKNVGHLKCHYRMSHRDSKPLMLIDSSVRCKICNQFFEQPSNLDYHLKTHFKKDRWDAQPYQCDICYKRFKLKSSLENHYDSHSNELSDEKVPNKHGSAYSEDEPNSFRKCSDEESSDDSREEYLKRNKQVKKQKKS